MTGETKFNNKVLSSKAIICDIEGTTTSISFVKETLFPYALKNVESFLTAHWDEEDTKNVVKELRQLSVDDLKNDPESGAVVISSDDTKEAIPSIVKSVEWLMSKDRKVDPLKTLQGMIWAKGYKDGTIKGHVYDDVPKAFQSWALTGHKIYIYSSGSVDAQKLLFGNSVHGDLMAHLDGYFDTKVGSKQESGSYTEIVKQISASAEDVLFLTDIVKEAEAAKTSGMNVLILDRPGNAPLTAEEKSEYIIISSLNDIPLEPVSVKRKIDEENPEAGKEEPPSKISKTETVEKPKEKVDKTNEKMEVDNDKSAEKPVTKGEEVVASSETDVKAEVPAKTEEKMEQDENVKTSEDKSIPEIVVVSSDDVVDSEVKKDSVVDTTVVEKVSTDTNDKVPTECTITEVTTSAEKAAPVVDTEVDEVSSSSKETVETEAEKPSTVSEEPASTKATNENKTTNVDDKANKEEKATNVEEKIDSSNGVAKETNGTSENGLKNGNGKEEKHDSDKENDEQGKNIPETPASPVVASDDKDVEDVVSDIKAKKAAAAIDSAAATAPIVASTET